MISPSRHHLSVNLKSIIALEFVVEDDSFNRLVLLKLDLVVILALYPGPGLHELAHELETFNVGGHFLFLHQFYVADQKLKVVLLLLGVPPAEPE